MVNELAEIFVKLDVLIDERNYTSLDHVMTIFCFNNKMTAIAIGIMRYLKPFQNQLPSWDICYNYVMNNLSITMTSTEVTEIMRGI